MERFSLIAVILFFLSGCATEIISTNPYHDVPKFDYTKNKYVFKNVWQRIHLKDIKVNYRLDYEKDIYIRRFLKDKEYLERLINKGEFFIFEVLNELDNYNLPSSLALLPYIESNYDPFSVSKSGAVGLWQLMPTTGRIYDLESNWWVEERHDPVLSTRAAVKYLDYLYNRFNQDLILTLIAYHAGPTFLERRINGLKKSGKKITFKNLRLSTATKIYVPKFLAIVEITKYPNKFNIDLPNFENKKLFQTIELNGQVEMLAFSEFSKIKPEFLYALNAGYIKWATPPRKSTNMNIPLENYDYVKNNINKFVSDFSVNWITHTVQSGDNLWNLSKKYEVKLDDLKRVNAKINSDILNINDVLLIPFEGISENTMVSYITHVVVNGDTILNISQKYGVSDKDIMSDNNIAAGEGLKVGDELQITEIKRQSLNSKGRIILYSVKQGDTLYKISEMFNMKIVDIVELNDIENKPLMPGQILRLILQSI